MKLGLLTKSTNLSRALWLSMPPAVRWVALSYRAAGVELPAAILARLTAIAEETSDVREARERARGVLEEFTERARMRTVEARTA